MTDMACTASNLTWRHLAVVYLLSISTDFGWGEKTGIVEKGQTDKAALLKCACKAVDGCDLEHPIQTCKEPDDLCMVTILPVTKAGTITIAGCTKPNFCKAEDSTTTCCNTTLCNSDVKGCQTRASPSKTTKYYLTNADDKTHSDYIPTRITQEPKPSNSRLFGRTDFWKLTTKPPYTSTADRKTPSTFCTLVFIGCTIAFTYSQPLFYVRM